MGNNVKIGCNVCVLGNSKIGDRVVLKSNTVVEDCVVENEVEICSSFLVGSIIKKGSKIGPFANIRKGSIIGENCKVGNFVEIKNSNLGSNTKVSHLAYVGDVEIGEYCNIGCGVIFCNYNGREKFRSRVGNFSFIGSNSNIVAPVQIGDYAYIAAGSTITKDVKDNEFAIARERQTNKENFKNPYKNKFNKN
ncbi:hypothetical protein J6Q66_07265 [bacterium]|nr:hypothetical protein [bacterium]